MRNNPKAGTEPGPQAMEPLQARESDETPAPLTPPYNPSPDAPLTRGEPSARAAAAAPARGSATDSTKTESSAKTSRARGSMSGSRSIPTKGPFSIPTPVLHACKKLRTAGFEAWLAGGCVRDMIMGRKPRDWDVVTDAPLDSIRELFPDRLEVGAAFGIIKLPPAGSKKDPVNIDIAIFRREEGYSDRRHPDVVEPGDPRTDSARRDFTVNALYFDPVASTVVDLVDGYKDIGAKILRTVGTPETRFSEDALRILRAVRFGAQLGFKIERQTAAALKKCARLLREISRERIREELIRTLESQRPVAGLELLAQFGLWEIVFGVKRVRLPADLRQLRMSWVPAPRHWFCAMGVTGLLGDPLREGAEIVDRATACLRLSNEEKRLLARTVRVYRDSGSDPVSSPNDWVELAREDRVLMDMTKSFVRRARGPSESEKAQAIKLIDQALRWAAKPGSEKTWPAAQQLMKEGFKQGPRLGAELRLREWRAFWNLKPS